MIDYVTDIFNRMLANKKLTPAERSFLKALFGLVVGVIASTIPQLPDALAGRTKFDFVEVLLVSGLSALLLAVSKLWAATKDPELGHMLDYYAEEMQLMAEGKLSIQQMPKYVSTDLVQSSGGVSNASALVPLPRQVSTQPIPVVPVRDSTPPPPAWKAPVTEQPLPTGWISPLPISETAHETIQAIYTASSGPLVLPKLPDATSGSEPQTTTPSSS
jgi:hypothetical protein